MADVQLPGDRHPLALTWRHRRGKKVFHTFESAPPLAMASNLLAMASNLIAINGLQRTSHGLQAFNSDMNPSGKNSMKTGRLDYINRI